MAIKETVTSEITKNQIEFFENTGGEMTILISQDGSTDFDSAVFCFEDLDDLRHFSKQINDFLNQIDK